MPAGQPALGLPSCLAACAPRTLMPKGAAGNDPPGHVCCADHASLASELERLEVDNQALRAICGRYEADAKALVASSGLGHGNPKQKLQLTMRCAPPAGRVPALLGAPSSDRRSGPFMLWHTSQQLQAAALALETVPDSCRTATWAARWAPSSCSMQRKAPAGWAQLHHTRCCCRSVSLAAPAQACRGWPCRKLEELEDIRRECTGLLRERFQLEQCVRWGPRVQAGGRWLLRSWAISQAATRRCGGAMGVLALSPLRGVRWLVMPWLSLLLVLAAALGVGAG